MKQSQKLNNLKIVPKCKWCENSNFKLMYEVIFSEKEREAHLMEKLQILKSNSIFFTNN